MIVPRFEGAEGRGERIEERPRDREGTVGEGQRERPDRGPGSEQRDREGQSPQEREDAEAFGSNEAWEETVDVERRVRLRCEGLQSSARVVRATLVREGSSSR